MFKRISHSNIFVTMCSYWLSPWFTRDLSAQSNRDEPSVGGSSKKAGKTSTYKKAQSSSKPSTAKKVVKIVEALRKTKNCQST